MKTDSKESKGSEGQGEQSLVRLKVKSDTQDFLRLMRLLDVLKKTLPAGCCNQGGENSLDESSFKDIWLPRVIILEADLNRQSVSSRQIRQLKQVLDLITKADEKQLTELDDWTKFSVDSFLQSSLQCLDFSAYKNKKESCGFSSSKNAGKTKVEDRLSFRKRKESLLRKQEQREYDEMCSNLSTPRSTVQGEVGELRKVLKELSPGISMILMILSVFVAGYFWASKVLGRSTQTGLITGLILGIAMLFIEMILFVIRATREERYAKQKKQRPYSLLGSKLANPQKQGKQKVA